MSKIEVNNSKNAHYEIRICYNCGFQVDDPKQKLCPNCQVILNPNTYINWKKSWYGFLCCLCVFPFLIVFLVNLFFDILGNFNREISPHQISFVFEYQNRDQDGLLNNVDLFYASFYEHN